MEEEIQNLRKEVVYIYFEGFENPNLRSNATDFSLCETSEDDACSGWSDFDTFSVISSHHD